MKDYMYVFQPLESKYIWINCQTDDISKYSQVIEDQTKKKKMKLKAKEKAQWEKYLPHSKRNQGSISKAHV